MSQNPRTLSIVIVASLAALLLAAPASAEYLVPEGNSAVTQYTEGLPTAGGERKTEGNEKSVTAAKAIGADNARKLEDHGSDGAAVAEIAAETSPEATSTSVGSAGGEASGSGQPAGDGDRQEDDGQDGKSGSGAAQEEGAGGSAVPSGDGPDGSSGLGEIVGAATGSSSGSLGLLLPLAILAALAWGFAFLWRQHRHPDSTAGTKT